MKNSILTGLAVVSFLVCADASQAQVFGQFTGAGTLPVNGRMFGAYAHSSENLAGLLAQLRLSFYPNVDFGFQGGIARQDFAGGSKTTIRLGADLKFGVRQPDASFPLAVAAGADLGVETGDSYTMLTVGPTLVASRDFAVGQNGGITPYAGIGLAFKRIDVDSHNDTDVSVPLRLGSEFQLTPQLKLAIELQLHMADSFNDNVGLAAGANLPF